MVSYGFCLRHVEKGVMSLKIWLTTCGEVIHALMVEGKNYIGEPHLA